jgi:hypothetical protein
MRVYSDQAGTHKIKMRPYVLSWGASPVTETAKLIFQTHLCAELRRPSIEQA